jgi:hypothetical protein
MVKYKVKYANIKIYEDIMVAKYKTIYKEARLGTG